MVFTLFLSSDHERHCKESKSVRSLSRRQSSGAAADVGSWFGEVSEEFKWLPGLQEKRLPEVLLYFWRRTALYPRQPWSTVRARTYDQGNWVRRNQGQFYCLMASGKFTSDFAYFSSNCLLEPVDNNDKYFNFTCAKILTLLPPRVTSI